MNEIDWEKLSSFLGISDLTSRVPEGARMRFELGSLPQGQGGLAMALAAAALVGLAFWLYKREGQSALWKKFTLAFLRTLTIGLCFLVLLEPRLAVDVERTDHANTIVLWDDSLSMSLPDRYLDEPRRKAVEQAAGIRATGGSAAETDGTAKVGTSVTAMTRQELAWRIIEKADLLKRLEVRNRIKLYAFGDEARALATDKLAPADLKPKGGATDLAKAVRRALEEQGGRTVAAIVAITDGRINKGEGPKAVAAELKERGIPFYAIGIGDPTAPKNIELQELVCNERAYKGGDPLVIEARVRHRGYQGEKVDVEFSIAPADAPERSTKLGVESVELAEDGKTVAKAIKWKPNELGKFIVTVKVPVREEELIKEDNERSAQVQVIDDETKILLIGGGPTYEWRHLTNMLIRDKSTKVSTFLQSADDAWPQQGLPKIDAIPRTKEQLREYDVICLLDPNPAGFDRELMENIKDFVERQGGGILYVAGEKYTASFVKNEDLRAILALLPIDIDQSNPELENHGPFTEQWPYKLTDEAEDSAITRLDQNPERSKAIWPKLPGSFWHFPGIREKPGATVLVRQADERSGGKEPPLIITHFYGPGRTMFCATDETWRWRALASKYYDRFWIQSLRYLIEGRLLGGARRVELTVDKNDYALGETVRIRAKAKDRGLKPLEAPAVTVVARAQDGDTFNIVLKEIEGRKGHYEALYIPEARGTFDLSLRLPDFNADDKAAAVTFSVRLSDLEMTNPRLDEETLNEIALATGGALCLLVGEKGADPAKAAVSVQTLPDRIPDRTETLVVAGQPVPLWDNRTTLIAACVLLGLEWFFRKRLRMV